ncbi:Phosphatidylinositol glycan anchor biosynthesis class U protein [Trichoplax sp. H2]|nr:Phosphatidylinositol glycan anchor biosynthesis class U protein [Trichoplax sp. H2]|eukprot:RDD47105.1 Phosphatidylinositol glycan anchor biosynthesis class U protein [Trichoplax sp. H2]
MIVISILLAIASRLLLFQSDILSKLMINIAINTPITSWNRVVEGITYIQNGIPAYSGDNFHQTPLVLSFFYLLRNSHEQLLNLVFIVFDLGISYNLYHISKHTLSAIISKEEKIKSKISKSSNTILVNQSSIMVTPTLVSILYLLHPFSILTCIAKSVIIINNYAVTLAILLTLKRKGVAAMLALAAASYQSLYPFMLVIPLSLHLCSEANILLQDNYSMKRSQIIKFINYVICFCLWFVILLGTSYILLGSWDFMRATYGFILSAPDMEPNLGLFWYFFTEMFDHFKLFFLFVFQINAFFYLVPLTFRLRYDPIFLTYLTCLLIAAFKSYPSLGDLTFTLALLPVWSHLLKYCRNSFVIVIMILSSTVLAPILWYLWIYAGSANANFFYAVTLMHSTAQVFLVADLLYSYIIREHDLYHGTERDYSLTKPLLSQID